MAKEFEFHQALFGYDAGHHLLASSLNLPVDARHMLAVATDLSGSSPASGFDVTYTGLPVAGTDYYALFCTWLALEMPRPGCVWSHVVFIHLADFAELQDLGDLRRIFRRPNSSELNSYQKPLPYQAAINSKSSLASEVEIFGKQIVAALYTMPEQAIVASTDAAAELEDLIFAIWSQQWPRLRRNFRFSTGSFADRGRGGAAFDLQVTPAANRRAWQRGGKHWMVGTGLESTPAFQLEIPAWTGMAVDDLLFPDKHSLRSFLFEHGAEFENLRSSFAKLAGVSEYLADAKNNWAAKLSYIGEIFPAAAEAIRLKEWVLGSRHESDPEPDLERIWTAVNFMLGNREAKAYAKAFFDLAASAPILWQKKRDPVLSLLGRLVRQQENPTATAFAAAIANAIQAGELKYISDAQPELIPIFISHRPALAFEVSTWQLPEPTQWQITEVLNKLPLDQKDWGEIMGAKFIAATFVAVRESVDKAGGHAIRGVSRWLEGDIGQECLPSQLWREALAAPVADCLRGKTSLPPATLALCAWFIPPETVRQLLSVKRTDIQQLAQQPLDRLPKPLRLPTAFLLVTLGLRASGIEGVRLIKRGYFEVYDALATSTASQLNFPWESWLLLSSELPQPGILRDWDRCKRLRKAVRQWVIQHAPSENPLLAVASKKEHSEIARKTLEEDAEADDFID